MRQWLVISLLVPTSLFLAGSGCYVGFSSGYYPPYPPYPYSLGAVTSLDLGDFDGDGNVDALIGSRDANAATLADGDGGGGVHSDELLGLPMGQRAEIVRVGHFDAGTDLDAVVLDAAARLLYVFLGGGDGTFTQAATSPEDLGAGVPILAMRAAPVNGDALTDLLLVDENGNLTTWLATGAGDFAISGMAINISGATDVDGGLIDGDANLDLIVAVPGLGGVSVLLGDGAGTFAHATGSPFFPGTSPTYVALLDADGAAGLDLAVLHADPARLTVWLGAGDGTFAPGPDGAIGLLGDTAYGLVRSLDPASLDDLATVTGFSGNPFAELAKLTNAGGGSFGLIANSVVRSPLAVAGADLTNDGVTDILLGYADPAEIRAFMGRSE